MVNNQNTQFNRNNMPNNMQRPQQMPNMQRNMGMPQQHGLNGQNNMANQKRRCFITESARQIVDSGMINSPMKTYLGMYLRKRAISIILTVAIIIILLTSSIFTDFGFDIGDYILSWFV